MGEHEMNRGEDHDEVGKFDRFAGTADGVMEFLQWFSSGHHVHYVYAHFNDKLLRHHNVEAELLAEGMLTQFVVSVKPFPRNHLVHLHHLP